MCTCKYTQNLIYLIYFLNRLVQKRNIRTQRRRATSRNPLKVLAARTDLRSEYTEIRTDIVARTIKNFNIEKREHIQISLPFHNISFARVCLFLEKTWKIWNFQEFFLYLKKLGNSYRIFFIETQRIKKYSLFNNFTLIL